MIETKDLILDKARYEDWEPMYRNVWSRPESFRYMKPAPSPNESEAQDRMRRTIDFQAGQAEAYTVFLKATREAIGFTGINCLEGAVWEETGICIGPDFWRRGYGWQILGALIARARELGAKEFIYSSWEENTASRSMAEKAGFRQYAVEEHVREHDGKEYKMIKYRLALGDKSEEHKLSDHS